jgi:hypothetical protein
VSERLKTDELKPEEKPLLTAKEVARISTWKKKETKSS